MKAVTLEQGSAEVIEKMNSLRDVQKLIKHSPEQPALTSATWSTRWSYMASRSLSHQMQFHEIL